MFQPIRVVGKKAFGLTYNEMEVLRSRDGEFIFKLLSDVMQCVTVRKWSGKKDEKIAPIKSFVYLRYHPFATIRVLPPSLTRNLVNDVELAALECLGLVGRKIDLVEWRPERSSFAVPCIIFGSRVLLLSLIMRHFMRAPEGRQTFLSLVCHLVRAFDRNFSTTVPNSNVYVVHLSSTHLPPSTFSSHLG